MRAAFRSLLGAPRPDAPPHLLLPRRTWLLAPLCGVLVALCAVLAGWHGAPRPESAGFDLRAGGASSNVDNDSAKAPHAADPAAVPTPVDTSPAGREEPPPPTGSQSAEPPLAPESDLPLPPAPPLPKAPSGGGLPPVMSGPLLPPWERPASPRESQPGDDPMPHLKTLGPALALAAALSAPPLATAGDVEKTPTLEQTAKDVKELKDAQEKSSKELMEALKAIQKQLEPVEGLRRDAESLKKDVKDLDRAFELLRQLRETETADLRAQLKQLREELAQAKKQAEEMQGKITASSARCDGLTEELTDLRKKLADTSRQAARLTENIGTVKLYNTSDRTISVILNNQGPAHRLEPGAESPPIRVPLGAVNYEILGLGSEYRRSRTLTADRPLEIEVYDLARGPIKTAPRP